MRIGNKLFDIKNKTYIMGILNMTPDSFSDGGSYPDLDSAMKRVEVMISEGADLIDVGGESTRPGYTVIPDQEEIDRIMPVIEKICKTFDVPVSVDTYKSAVAQEAFKAGAHLVNDIWGFKYDPQMARVTKAYDAACCLMHNRREAVYGNLIQDCIDDLDESVELAKAAGISDDRIMLDPGVGFAKSYEENLEVIRSLNQFADAGYPVLLGTSRKSVIGLTLDLPKNERMEGTLVTTVFAVLHGCSFIRVHDIKENKRAIMMADAILGRI